MTRGKTSFAPDTSDGVIGLSGALDVADIATLSGAAAAADVAEIEVDLAEIIAGAVLDNTVQALTPGAAVAANAALGHVATLTMDASATTTITISNLTAGQSMTFIVTQNSAGSKALVFAATFFAGGTEPTQTATASAVDIYTVVMVGTQLYGFVAGQDMKT